MNIVGVSPTTTEIPTTKPEPSATPTILATNPPVQSPEVTPDESGFAIGDKATFSYAFDERISLSDTEVFQVKDDTLFSDEQNHPIQLTIIEGKNENGEYLVELMGLIQKSGLNDGKFYLDPLFPYLGESLLPADPDKKTGLQIVLDNMAVVQNLKLENLGNLTDPSNGRVYLIFKFIFRVPPDIIHKLDTQ